MSHACEGCGVEHPTAIKAQECFAAHRKLEYTYDHLEAGACMWEHVLDRLRRGNRGPWHEYKDAYGMAALRATVIRHAPTLQEAYERAVDNGYDQPFDWEYVPKYMEDHIARVLAP